MKVVGIDGQVWPLADEAAALWTRIATLKPEAMTVVLEGALVDGKRVWMTVSAPQITGIVIGHARVLETMAEDLLPGDG